MQSGIFHVGQRGAPCESLRNFLSFCLPWAVVRHHHILILDLDRLLSCRCTVVMGILRREQMTARNYRACSAPLQAHQGARQEAVMAESQSPEDTSKLQGRSRTSSPSSPQSTEADLQQWPSSALGLVTPHTSTQEDSFTFLLVDFLHRV